MDREQFRKAKEVMNGIDALEGILEDCKKGNIKLCDGNCNEFEITPRIKEALIPLLVNFFENELEIRKTEFNDL